MSNTVKMTVNDSWTTAAEDAANVAIQIRTQGRLMVFLGESAPDANSPGLVIAGTQTFSASDIPAGSNVYIRSATTAPVDAVVMSY